MKYYHHFLINTFAGLTTAQIVDPPSTGLYVAGMVAGGLLIDADHVLNSWWRQKTWQPKKIAKMMLAERDIYDEGWKPKYRKRFLAFHHLEVGSLLSYYGNHHPGLMPFTLGYWLHVFSDWLRLRRIDGDFRFMKEWVFVYKIFCKLKTQNHNLNVKAQMSNQIQNPND